VKISDYSHSAVLVRNHRDLLSGIIGGGSPTKNAQQRDTENGKNKVLDDQQTTTELAEEEEEHSFKTKSSSSGERPQPGYTQTALRSVLQYRATCG
jgi:hypothetical protein